MSDIDQIIDFVLNNECGFVIDQGGPTNFGITAKYLMDHGRWEYDRNHNGVIDEEDMRNFTREDAIKEYGLMFTGENYQLLNYIPLVTRVFDTCVNSGAHEANLLLQRSYNHLIGKNILTEDGILGFATVARINQINDPNELINKFKAERSAFYRLLANQNPEKYGKDLEGWLKRAAL